MVFTGSGVDYLSTDIASGGRTVLYNRTEAISTQIPLIKPFDDKIFLITENKKGLFYDFLGKHLEPIIDFGDRDTYGVAAKHPYLLSLHKDRVDVHSMTTGGRLQTIAATGCTCISEGANIFVASRSAVHLLSISSLESQVDQLLAQSKPKEALSLLLDASRDDPQLQQQKRSLSFRIAASFLGQGKLTRCFDLLEESSKEVDPLHILRYFPHLLSKRTVEELLPSVGPAKDLQEVLQRNMEGINSVLRKLVFALPAPSSFEQ